MNPSSQTHDFTQNWDASWASLETHMVRLYTRGRPRNIHQFWQRCYADDLWMLMGDRAEGGRYLELGAGRGTTSMYLASKGCDVTMLDLSCKAFEVAKLNFAQEGLVLPKLVHADARDTHLLSASYDCVLSIGLLEHFEDPRPVLAEAARLLRPGGLHFAVIIPGRPTNIRNLAFAMFRPWSLAWEFIPHDMRSRLRKRSRRSAAPDANAMLRTDYQRSDYLNMLNGLDLVEARCVPYNPYHSIYNTPFLEANVSIPLYRGHRMLKRVFSSPPLAKTISNLACCDLLTFRKRGEQKD